MASLATTTAEWPSTYVPAPVKKFMDDFFVVMDNNTPDAGYMLAADFFTPTATFILSGGKYVGSEGQSCCAEAVRALRTLTRKH